jgi:hypothetical protein
MTLIHGLYCQFRTGSSYGQEEFAKKMVAYGDQKIPQVFAALGFGMGDQKVCLEFGPYPGGMYIGDRTIKLGHQHGMNDKGCLIQEVVRIAQEPGFAFMDSQQPRTRFLYAGIAGYYRVTMSDDHQGDYPDDSKRTLSTFFSPDDHYGSGAEFVAYLRRRTSDPDFVRSLNNALKVGSLDAIEAFFRERFAATYQTVLDSYPQYRNVFLKREPWSIGRFSFFTELQAPT